MFNDFVKALEEVFSKYKKDMKSEYKKFIQTITNGQNLKKEKINISTVYEQKEKDNNYIILQDIEKEAIKDQYKNKEREKKQRELIKKNIKDPEKQKIALDTIDDQSDAKTVAKELKADVKELEKIFSSAIEKMIKGTEDFSSITKTLMNDLVNYFAKSAAEAVAKGIIDSTIGQSINSALSGVSSFTSGSINSGVNFIGGLIGSIASIFGSHHSGGLIGQGTGTLPGTSEYLSILKGGERVLSPAENSAYQGNGNNGQNVVVNNFNVQAWNSKDVQKYLLENKNLIGKITAENIKYNNSNLRYMIGG